jgi:hypothetical protein
LRVIIISGQPVPKEITLPDEITFFQKPFAFERLIDVVRGFLHS